MLMLVNPSAMTCADKQTQARAHTHTGAQEAGKANIWICIRCS